MEKGILKRIFSGFLAGIVTLTALPITAFGEALPEPPVPEALAAEAEALAAEDLAEYEERKSADYTSGDYGYNILDDGTIEIADYTGSDTEITIPSEIDGYKVTGIGYDAFRNCDSLTNIIIPDSVTTIGSSAFEGCDSLTNITIPDSVTTIGYSAFEGCDSLTNITIPDSVTTIGSSAFEGCDSLTNITIPDSVTTIGSSAFEGCDSLTSITIPDSITRIGQFTFQSCGLTSLVIPNNVTSIDAFAFFACTSLTSITIPDSVTSINNCVFGACFFLTDVYYTGSEEQWNNISIGNENSYLTDATIHYNYVNPDSPKLPPVSTSNNGSVEIKTESGETITVTSTNNSLHKLKSAVFKCGSSETDLLTTSKVLTVGQEINGQSTFTITCKPKGDAENIVQYQLYCGKKLVKTTATDIFTISPSELIKGTDYYIVTIGKNRTSTKSSIMLDVESEIEFTETELTLGGTDGFKFSVGDDCPILNGLELSTNGLLKSPLRISITDNGTLRVGVNVGDDLLDDDDQWYDYKKDFEKAVKSLNEASKVGNKSLTDLKKYLKTPKQKSNLILSDVACDVTVAGFGEVSVKSGSVQTVSLNVIISADLNYTHKHQFVAWVVPIAFEIKIGVKGEFEGILSYNIPDNALSGSAMLKVGGYVQPFIGVGVVGVIGAGVTGKAELTFQIVLLSSTEASGLKKVDLSGSVGLKGYIGPFEAEYTLLKGTFNVYSRGSTAQSSTVKSSLSSLYDTDSYTEVSTKKYASSLVETSSRKDAAPSALLSDVYLAAEPELATDGENTVMVYLASDLERGAANQTVLMYSVYDGAEWSEPAKLDDNETTDWGAEIFNLGGDLWAIYQDSSAVFGDDVTTDELADSFVIKAAKFDSETGTFGTPVAVSGADGYNHSPVMGVVNGSPAAAWVNNTDTDFFGLNSTNSVMYSIYSDGEWSEPAAYAEGLNAVTSLAAAENNGEMYIAYMTDGDNDFTTTDDVSLSINNAVVSSGSIAKLMASELPSVSGTVIYWCSGGDISYYDFSSAAVKNVFGESTVSSDYSVTSDSILYAASDSDGNSCVYITKYANGVWTAPVEAFAADNEITYFSACDDIAVMVDTEMTISDEEISDSSELKYCLYNEKYDIGVEYVDFDSESITEGENLSLIIGISNNSTEVLNSVSIKIEDSSSTLTETTVDCGIAAGESGEITLEMPVNTVDSTEYTVTVTNSEDTDTSNNSETFDLGKTELTVTTKEILNGNTAYLVVDVDNESYISAAGTLTITDEEGTALKTIAIDSIDGKDKYREIIPVSELLSEGQTSAVVTASVTTESEEYYTFNNTTEQYIRDTDGDIPYVVVAFLNADGEEISSGVYDANSSVTPPELPDGCDGWTVLGDTTEQVVASFESIPTDVVFKAKAKSKLVPEVTAPTAKELTYNGSAQELVTAGTTTGGTMMYKLDDGAYSKNIPTAKNVGTYKVYYKVVGDDDYADVEEAFVTVEISAAETIAKPVISSASAGDGSVTLKWSGVDGASKYRVFYYVNSKYTNAGDTTSTSYTVSGLTNGTKYGFLVRAYGNGVWSDYSTADNVYATPVAAAVKPTVTAYAGNGKVRLNWTKVEGAAKYAIYTYSGGKYTHYKNTTLNYYNVTGLTNGTKYGFLVRAYVDGAWTAYEKTDNVYATPVEKPVVTAYPGNSKVRLNWTKVEGATKYAIYTYSGGKYSLYKATTANAYNVTGLTNGTKYTFLVRAYVNGAWTAYNAYDRVSSTPIDKPAVTAYAGSGKVRLNWTKVEGATKYAIYTYSGGKYSLYKATTANAYNVTGLTNGTKYTFLVRAYVNGAWTAYNAYDRVSAAPIDKPVISSATAGNSKVTLKWSAVSGATKYAVYTYSDGKYTLFKNVTSASCAVTGLTNGTKYGFLVRAYVNGAWTAYNVYDRVYATPTA